MNFADVLFNLDAERGELNAAIRSTIPAVLAEIDEKLSKSPFYITGSGHDFDVFAARVAKSDEYRVLGAACISASPMRHPFPSGLRSFAIMEEMIEQHEGTPTLLLCQTVVADEFEVISMVSRLEEEIDFRHLLVVTLAINDAVQQNLEELFSKQENFTYDFVALRTFERDIRPFRDALYRNLDDRPLKLVPVTSRWMMERMFGPKPDTTNTPPEGGSRFGFGSGTSSDGT